MNDDFTGPHCQTCGTGAGGLRVLADLLDQKYPNNPNNEVQNDLRKWAREIEKAVEWKAIQARMEELREELRHSTESSDEKERELQDLLIRGLSL